jgi:hypothetical protein
MEAPQLVSDARAKKEVHAEGVEQGRREVLEEFAPANPRTAFHGTQEPPMQSNAQPVRGRPERDPQHIFQQAHDARQAELAEEALKALSPEKEAMRQKGYWVAGQGGITLPPARGADEAHRAIAAAQDPRHAAPAQMLDQMQPVSYKYKDGVGEDPNKQQFGVMAQDLEKSPMGASAVRQGPDGLKTVDQAQGLGVALGGLTNLHQRVRELEMNAPQLPPGIGHLPRRSAMEPHAWAMQASDDQSGPPDYQSDNDYNFFAHPSATNIAIAKNEGLLTPGTEDYMRRQGMVPPGVANAQQMDAELMAAHGHPVPSDRNLKTNVASAERSIKDFLNQVYRHA